VCHTIVREIENEFYDIQLCVQENNRLRSVLVGDVMQHRLVVSYQPFLDNLSDPSSRVKQGLIDCHKTLVTNYQSTLRNIQVE
jgi:hypothetical protein